MTWTSLATPSLTRYRWWLPVLATIAGLAAAGVAHAQSNLSPRFAAGEARLSASERAGREIWFFATAFNDRFYSYTYPQRLGGAIDWHLILSAKRKRDLFQAWGAIPDPDCCIPGDAGCPAKSLEDTYGFQWCPGDEELLKFIGREGYRDPACDFRDAPFDVSTPHGAVDQRQSSCDLRFGTSTGALGLRKFPNPRFDRDKWLKLNGSAASWDGYRAARSDGQHGADARASGMFDGSIEPPFRIGMACGACHIGYDPLRPPRDPNQPKWENIDGLIGNQYSRMSQMMASGLSRHQLEWQLIAQARPGIVDTSVLPMDTVSNPSTINAIINLAKRPVAEHRVLKWRKASACPVHEEICWCEPRKPGKCWLRSEQNERVHNILKGGEDSIGAAEAVQRVYFNIGSCAEQCWINHVSDLRAVDPTQRNYGQTPFDIGQCRRDCAGFRAIEDRLGDILAFLATARPADLWKARGYSSPAELDTALDAEFGSGSIELGRQVFARTCASCHSSQDPPHDNVDFRAVDPRDPTLRIDWLSNGRPIPVGRIGTYAARALHSNHMATRVWDQYAARDLHERPPDPGLKEIMKGGGRGYYRPASLLSIWATAPFLHNDAVGPELCGTPSDAALDFYVSPYVERNGKPPADPPPCWPYDPSVEGRWRLYIASMEQLLNPDKRIPKMFLTGDDIIVRVAPSLKIADRESGFSLRIPKGYPAVLLNSLRYKDLIQDLVLRNRDPAKLAAKYQGPLTREQLQTLKDGLAQLAATLLVQSRNFTLEITQVQHDFIQTYYSNVLQRVENAGHRFGEHLSEREKRALIAYLATL
jgi:mono/diheme cytochrome c family protein